MELLSLSLMIIIAYLLIPFLRVAIAVNNTITQSQALRDGTTIVSPRGTFELGFFTPGNTNKRYLGIWYKNIKDHRVVWVANRINPINDSSGTLTINNSGDLVLGQNDTVVWSTTSLRKPESPIAILLDSGNLVVRDQKEANPEAYLWQSFDYPTDTLLPGMKVGWDLRLGLNRRLTAWKNYEDPAPGEFHMEVVLNSYPDIYIMWGNKPYHRFGPWNGLRFSDVPGRKPNPNFDHKFVSNKDEVYCSWSVNDDSLISIKVLNQTVGSFLQYVWEETDKQWRVNSNLPTGQCKLYGTCGAFGYCEVTESPSCQCLKGFSPKSPQEWASMNWSQGCARHKPLHCTDKLDEFVKLVDLKVPDTTHTWLDETIGLEECRAKCLNNCSCMLYANSDIRGQGSGCVMWFGDLIDMGQFVGFGQDLYIRMDASELGSKVRVNDEEAKRGGKKTLKIVLATATAAILGMIFVGIYYIYRVRSNRTEGDQDNAGPEDDIEFPLIDFSTIAMATDNFSTINKIGEGGFGPVYKGRLEHGQEIAVKRLSKSSGQGTTEFKNEVNLIAKVQHRNLVRLLGCCIHGQDKILVYEYMPNGSLDSYIFDVIEGKVLDWSKHFLIICGIARGLMYLHKDSRLRIIHRDLKASNVLLDDKLNPKISDFGMARIIGGDQTEGNTNRVVGTYGYMAPEYASDGLFSVKSDVFSFGILLLEIIYGKRNRGFYHADLTLNLVVHAWILWKEGRTSEMIDQNIEESCILPEVLRCIHIGLLCVQQHPEDRPTMSSVVLMLESEIELLEPKEPGFFPRKGLAEGNSSPSQLQFASTNEMTITLLEAR